MILGLVGVAATLALGIVVLTFRAKKVEAGFEANGVTSGIVVICREILTIAKFDLALLFVVIADMVLKPEPSDWATLVPMAIVLVVAAVLWLMPGMRKPAVPA